MNVKEYWAGVERLGHIRFGTRPWTFPELCSYIAPTIVHRLGEDHFSSMSVRAIKMRLRCVEKYSELLPQLRSLRQDIIIRGLPM